MKGEMASMNKSHKIHDIIEIRLQTIDKSFELADKPQANEVLMIYVLQGYGKLLTTDTSISLNLRELLLFTKSGEAQDSIFIQPTMAMSLFIIKFTSISVYRQNGEWFVDEMIPRTETINKVNHSLISYYQETLYRKWENKEMYNVDFQDYFYRMIAVIETITSQYDNQKNVLEHLKSYLDHHFDEPIQVNDLVTSSGLNLTTFYKEFKDHTGYTPLQYITKKRVNKAKKLLSSTSLQISDISNEVGYQDVYYFSRVFKRSVGVSPQKFARLSSRRFYVLSPAFAADLLALGISKDFLYPVSKYHTERFLMKPKKEDFNLEELSSLKPDCIICHQEAEILTEHLPLEASTLFISYKRMTWREQLLELSTEIGSRDIAHKWLHQFDKRLDTVRKKVQDKIGNEAIVALRVLDGKVRLFGDKRRKLSDFLYRELKLNAPPLIQGIHYYDLDLDSEELKTLNAKHILIIAGEGEKEEIVKVKTKINGNIYEVSKFPWLSYSALGHERLLTEVVETLA